MTNEDYKSVQRWFDSYVATHCNDDGSIDPMLELKMDHSHRVAGHCKWLATELSWSCEDVVLAESLGLVHDVGRFSQFAKFRSFRDAETMDHGFEGRQILREANALLALPREEVEILLCGVQFHNGAKVPYGLAPREERFLRLVRDADKLDIVEIVLNSVETNGFAELPSLMPHIGLSRTPTPSIIAELRRGQPVLTEEICNLGDFLLMIGGWFHDMNYAPACRHLFKSGALRRLRALLPGGNGIDELFAEMSMARVQEYTTRGR